MTDEQFKKLAEEYQAAKTLAYDLSVQNSPVDAVGAALMSARLRLAQRNAAKLQIEVDNAAESMLEMQDGGAPYKDRG